MIKVEISVFSQAEMALADNTFLTLDNSFKLNLLIDS